MFAVVYQLGVTEDNQVPTKFFAQTHGAVGEYLTGERCDECRACERRHADANFRFVSAGALDRSDSCAEQCAAGMFDEFELGACKPYSSPSCGTGEYLRVGTATADYACLACSTCSGARLVAPCTATADAQCEPCAGTLGPGEIWAAQQCERACRAAFVRNAVSGACEYCDFACPPGMQTASPRLNCSHCQPCAQPPTESITWIAGCDWACAEGFVFADGACVGQANNSVAAVSAQTTVLCPPGTAPSGVFACAPCDETTLTPPTGQLDVTWTWRDSGLPCEWHCLPPLVKHRIHSGVGVACVSWSAYRATVRVAANSSGLLAVPTPPPLNTLTRWEFLVAAGCVVALIAVLLVAVR